MGRSEARPTEWIDAVIINQLFLRAPGKLESPQTTVFALGAPKMYSLYTDTHQALDAMPYDQIICAELLKSLVRRGVLINGVVPQVEEYRGGNCARPALCENDESNARFEDMIVDVAEK